MFCSDSYSRLWFYYVYNIDGVDPTIPSKLLVNVYKICVLYYLSETFHYLYYFYLVFFEILTFCIIDFTSEWPTQVLFSLFLCPFLVLNLYLVIFNWLDLLSLFYLILLFLVLSWSPWTSWYCFLDCNLKVFLFSFSYSDFFISLNRFLYFYVRILRLVSGFSHSGIFRYGPT